MKTTLFLKLFFLLSFAYITSEDEEVTTYPPSPDSALTPTRNGYSPGYYAPDINSFNSFSDQNDIQLRAYAARPRARTTTRRTVTRTTPRRTTPRTTPRRTTTYKTTTRATTRRTTTRTTTRRTTTQPRTTTQRTTPWWQTTTRRTTTQPRTTTQRTTPWWQTTTRRTTTQPRTTTQRTTPWWQTTTRRTTTQPWTTTQRTTPWWQTTTRRTTTQLWTTTQRTTPWWKTTTTTTSTQRTTPWWHRTTTQRIITIPTRRTSPTIRTTRRPRPTAKITNTTLGPNGGNNWKIVYVPRYTPAPYDYNIEFKREHLRDDRLGVFLLERLLTTHPEMHLHRPTSSRPEVYDRYHVFYNRPHRSNKTSEALVQPDKTISAKDLAHCKGNVSTFCPDNTNTACLRKGEILCLTKIEKTVPCSLPPSRIYNNISDYFDRSLVYNSTQNETCVDSWDSRVPCHNMDPNGTCFRTNQSQFNPSDLLRIKCLYNVIIEGHTHVANKTILPGVLKNNNNTSSNSNMTSNATVVVGNVLVRNNSNSNPTLDHILAAFDPSLKLPVHSSGRNGTNQTYCLTILARPMENEQYRPNFNVTPEIKNIFGLFVYNAFGLKKK